jgi:outer membrane protein OmpA-like peptidoglycan-associated protein
MKAWKATLLILLLFVSVPLFGETHSGTDLYLFGSSVRSMGRGGTGVATEGSDIFYRNPASIARSERFNMGLQYGTLQGTYYNPDLSLAFPTAYGVFGFSFRYVGVPDSYDFNHGYGFSLGAAKDITSHWMLGLSLNFLYAGDRDKSYYLGATLGTTFHFRSVRGKHGFGLIDPSIGISVNAGVPFGNRPSVANLNELTLGYKFIFFDHEKVDLAFFNDLSMVHGYTSFPVKLGLEVTVIDSIYIRGGMIIPSFYDYGDATFGLGYRYEGETFAISADYSFAWYRDTIMVHYLGLNFEYGRLDREAPETGVDINHRYISPNHDGSQDTLVLDLEVLDASHIKSWKLQILDYGGDVVREYRPDDRDVIRGIGFREFFRRLFSRKTSRVVPGRILWNGKNDSGVPVPDGRYTYRFSAWDVRNNVSTAKTGVVVVDRVPPEVDASTSDYYFSPNGDGNKDLFVVNHRVTSQPGDTWKASIRNIDGEKIRTWSWEGEPPYRLTWDGRNDRGEKAPEGLYSYRISSTDRAGNHGEDILREISLRREYEIADVRLSRYVVSHEKIDSIRLFPELSSLRGLESWTVEVLKNGRREKSFSGTTAPPAFIDWNLTDERQKKLNDGEYGIRLSAEYQSGNRPRSFVKELVVDTTPPDLSMGHWPDLFSPDGDGRKDVCRLKLSARDRTGIQSWKVTIFDPAGKPFRTFTGSGKPPGTIRWDGLGDNQELVESASDYFARLEAVDKAGNRGVSEKEKIAIDILVLVTERGLKMRISNITFGINSAKLTGKGSSILRRVTQILRKYRSYDVIIEGHTDEIGKEEYNLELSEKRAKSVHDFLVRHGIKKERLSFMGMGETVPLYPNTSRENRRRNRRVEFLLIKKEERGRNGS